MAGNIGDFEESRRKLAAEAEAREIANERAKARQLMEASSEANKDVLAKQAFANAFIDILREVNRSERGCPGGEYLARFLEMMNRGPMSPWASWQTRRSKGSCPHGSSILRVTKRTEVNPRVGIRTAAPATWPVGNSESGGRVMSDRKLHWLRHLLVRHQV
jgi:hypothetical protein